MRSNIFTQIQRVEKHPHMSKGVFTMKDKDREKFLANFIKTQQESARREADSSRRKQDLMRQFENIFFQMTQHKWAEPFMKPVDVIGLGLHDYYELDKVDAHLEELKEMALQNCRKMTTEEKKRLGSAITRLPPDDINKALEIIAQTDPTFQVAGETVEVDIDAQSESTLWKLKLFVKDTLQAQTKSSPMAGGNINSIGENNQNANNRRKREICDALVMNSQKKNKKLPTG